MKQQNYDNHIFYYWPHHFVYYGAIAIGFVACGLGMWKYEEQRALWGMAAFLIFLIVYLALMLRQHYALGNQNRIVRLEMRLRYFQLSGKRFEDIEKQLSFGRIAALRFAPDDELVALVDRAVSENLSADQIKKAIKNWLPDYMRV